MYSILFCEEPKKARLVGGLSKEGEKTRLLQRDGLVAAEGLGNGQTYAGGSACVLQRHRRWTIVTDGVDKYLRFGDEGIGKAL